MVGPFLFGEAIKTTPREPDDIDRGILARISEQPGISILDAIRPFLAQRSETVLRQRVRQLAILGEIRIDPTRHISKCYIADPSE